MIGCGRTGWAAAGVPAGLRIAGSALGAVLTVTALQAAFSGRAFAAPVPPATTAATAGSAATATTAVTAGPVAAAGPVAKHWGSFFGNTNGDVDTHWWPATVHLPGRIAQVASSNSTEYALLANGSLYAWGLGSQGELGDGGTGNSFEKPVRVRFPAGVKIASLPPDAMPYDTGLALDTRGRAWGWGRNAGGSLCLGTTRTYSTPVELPLRDVTTLAGASTHTLFDAGGTVYSCGANLSGDLGDGTAASSTTPVKVAGLGGRAVVQLVASFANSGALLSDGTYYDWGYDKAGQLGDGRTGRQSDVPVRVRLPGPVRQVALGGSIWDNGQTLVLLDNYAVWAWGNDSAGQLGNQAERSEPSPDTYPSSPRRDLPQPGHRRDHLLRHLSRRKGLRLGPQRLRAIRRREYRHLPHPHPDHLPGGHNLRNSGQHRHRQTAVTTAAPAARAQAAAGD